MTRSLILCTIIAALAGCTAGVGPPAETAERPVAVESQSAEEETLAIMLERAREARFSGQLNEAELLLESALRIAPGDARLWLELAETQFAGGEFEAASNLADRAIALSGGDASIVESARRLRQQAAE